MSPRKLARLRMHQRGERLPLKKITRRMRKRMIERTRYFYFFASYRAHTPTDEEKRARVLPGTLVFE